MSNNGFPGLPERPRFGNNNPHPEGIPGFNQPVNNVPQNPLSQNPGGFQRPNPQQGVPTNPFNNPVQQPQVTPQAPWGAQGNPNQQPQQMRPTGQPHLSQTQFHAGPQAVNPHGYNQHQPPVKNKKTATVLAIIFGILFSVTLIGSLAALAGNQSEVLEKQREVEDLQYENENLQQENTDMKTNLDNKETFGQLSLSYVEKLNAFNGMPVKDRLGKNVARYDALVQEAYTYREDPYMMQTVISDAQAELDDLEALRVKFENERNGNATGTGYEANTDSISSGITSVVWYASAEDKCGESEGSDAAACVWSNTPDLVYVNTDQYNRLGNEAGSRFRDYYYNGVVWHEFAHVLQFYNVETTDAYLPIFDNNREKMADCYADAFYSRDFSSYAYNLGCNGDQIAKVQEWAGAVKFVPTGFVQK